MGIHTKGLEAAGVVIPNSQFNRHFVEEMEKWHKDPNVVAIIIDDGGKPTTNISKIKGAFPILKNDTFEDVLNKYARVFAHEWQAFLKEMEIKKQDLRYEKGMSKGKTMRYFGSLPAHLYEIVNYLYPQYTESKKGWRRLSKILSKFFIGSI